MVSAFDEDKARIEFLVFLRNNDVFSTSVRGVTTASEQKTGDNSTVTFSFSNSGVKNVRSVVVDSVTLTNYVDYEVDYINQQITFTTAPSTGTNNIVISLDHGADKIYDDWPRDDLTIGSYPRIAFEFSSYQSRDGDLGGNLTESRVLISLTVFSSDTTQVIQTIKTIRNLVLNNKTGFTNMNYITVNSQGPMLVNDLGRNQIVQKNIDFVLPLVLEQ